MAASQQTVWKVIEVLGEHVDPATLRKVVNDLLLVDGNASFRATIREIDRQLKRRGV